MEVGREGDEADEDGDLEKQGRFNEGAAHVLLTFGQVSVGAVGGAVAVEGFYDGGDAAEGGEDAAWVDGWDDLVSMDSFSRVQLDRAFRFEPKRSPRDTSSPMERPKCVKRALRGGRNRLREW